MKILNVFMICVLYAAWTPPAVAADEAGQSMADMLAEMDHFPSAEEKATLSKIASDTGESEHLRTIAHAIARIEHQPTASDKKKLEAIVADDSATEAEKTLAGAVIRFEHKVSADDAAALEALSE